MKQKLIMENWRKFLKEDRDPQNLEEGMMQKILGGIGLMFMMSGGNPASADPGDILFGVNPESSQEIGIDQQTGLNTIISQVLQQTLNPDADFVTGKNLKNFMEKEGASLGDLSRADASEVGELTNTNAVEVTYTQLKDGVLVSLDLIGYDGVQRDVSFKVTDFGPEDPDGHDKNLEQINQGMAPALKFLNSKIQQTDQSQQNPEVSQKIV